MMTLLAPRRNRRVLIRPACPILTTRSICRSIKPSRPSTCSIIRGARLFRSASTYSSNILVVGCVLSTISLCEYSALPFEQNDDYFLHSAINTFFDTSYKFVKTYILYNVTIFVKLCLLFIFKR